MIEMLNEAIRCFQLGQAHLEEADRQTVSHEDREIIEAISDRIDELIGRLEDLQV